MFSVSTKGFSPKNLIIQIDVFSSPKHRLVFSAKNLIIKIDVFLSPKWTLGFSLTLNEDWSFLMPE